MLEPAISVGDDRVNLDRTGINIFINNFFFKGRDLLLIGRHIKNKTKQNKQTKHFKVPYLRRLEEPNLCLSLNSKSYIFQDKGGLFF